MFGEILSDEHFGADDEALAPGRFLLSHQYVNPESKRELALFITLENPATHCVIAAQSGRVIMPTRNWLTGTLWDVTNHVRIDVDPSSFRIDDDYPSVGEIAYAGAGEWLLGVQVNERHFRASWVNITSGSLVDRTPKFVRFSEWVLVERDGAKRTMFQRTVQSAAAIAA